MRHNQNGRRYRGRSNGNGGGGNGGGGQTHHHNSHSNNHGSGGGQRRLNPRVHTFDSNGPDVRIRGNAYQITEKYQTLAKDAASSGDRVLAESYLQHAEHYQRMINEMGDEYNRHQPQQGHNGQQPQQQPHQNQQSHSHGQHRQDLGDQPQMADPAESEQPVIDAGGLADLDQSFLVGPRRRGRAAPGPVAGEGEQPSVAVEPRGSRAAAKNVE